MGKRVAIVGVIAALAIGLTGCGAPPWADPTASPDASATATTPPTPVPNDLSTGSTQRSLTAGAVAATVDYWSDLTMDKWTASALPPGLTRPVRSPRAGGSRSVGGQELPTKGWDS